MGQSLASPMLFTLCFLKTISPLGPTAHLVAPSHRRLTWGQLWGAEHFLFFFCLGAKLVATSTTTFSFTFVCFHLLASSLLGYFRVLHCGGFVRAQLLDRARRIAVKGWGGREWTIISWRWCRRRSSTTRGSGGRSGRPSRMCSCALIIASSRYRSVTSRVHDRGADSLSLPPLLEATSHKIFMFASWRRKSVAFRWMKSYTGHAIGGILLGLSLRSVISQKPVLRNLTVEIVGSFFLTKPDYGKTFLYSFLGSSWAILIDRHETSYGSVVLLMSLGFSYSHLLINGMILLI